MESGYVSPAYLSNGFFGLRIGPNPLLQPTAALPGTSHRWHHNIGQVCAGFIVSQNPGSAQPRSHLANVPFALQTTLRVGWTGAGALVDVTQQLRPIRQTLELATGMLVTELDVDGPGGGSSVHLLVSQRASRAVPSLALQRIVATRSDSRIRLDVAPNPQPVPCGAGCSGRTTSYANFSVPPNANPPAAPAITVMGLLSYKTAPTGEALSRYGLAVGLQRHDDPTSHNRTTVFDTIAAQVSSAYHPIPDREALRLCNYGWYTGFEQLRASDDALWREIWQGRIVAAGPGVTAADQALLDQSLFYMRASTHPNNKLGVPPYTLSQSEDCKK